MHWTDACVAFIYNSGNIYGMRDFRRYKLMKDEMNTIARLLGEQLRSLPVTKRTIYVGGKPVWIQQYSILQR